MRRVPLSEIHSEFEKQVCWGDDERYLFNPLKKKASVFGHFLRIEEVLRLVDLFCMGKRVGDFACAQGNFGLLLAEKGYDVTAVDINKEFLEYAKKKYTHGKFETRLANLMDFRAETPFDCVLAGEVIEHVARPDLLLASAAANLNPGGILIVTTPNGNVYSANLPTFSQVKDFDALIPKQFHWGDHLFLYTLEELETLFKTAGFDVIFQEKYHSSYVSQIKAIRYLFPLRMLRWWERKTRNWKKNGRDSADLLIVVGKKRV
jgi:2-polyprenyl-3-methyl-5-hydroxy-6-metoxy-1,4-benzoquinol methylase